MTTSIADKANVNAKHYVELCYSDEFNNASLFYSAPAHAAQLVWLKTPLQPNAVNFLAKMNGHQTRQTLTFLTITSGELCWNTGRHFIPSQRTLMH